MLRSRSPVRRRPRLEALESRSLLTTFAVSSTDDSGPGTLRAAIIAANMSTSPGVVEIDFAIGSGGTWTIKPTSPLPTINRPVYLKGSSQSGYDRTPLIVIDGSLEPAGTDGLTIAGGMSTVEGLAVTHFLGTQPATSAAASNGGRGILLTGPGGDSVIRNDLGYFTFTPNGMGNGIGLEVDSPDATIGGAAGAGNRISGNVNAGYSREHVVEGDNILVDAVARVVIRGNLIGTGQYSSGSGIDLEGSTETIIGGTAAGDGNVIDDNGFCGIYINGQAAPGQATNALVEGNMIGLDAGGKYTYNGNGTGIIILGGGNTIGGSTRAAGNVISVSQKDGIDVTAIDADGNPLAAGGGNLIAGNVIGTDPTGTIGLGNQGAGIRASGGGTIGGSVAGAGNLVSGNEIGAYPTSRAAAIVARGFTIQGNRVGTDVTGRIPLRNFGPGVTLMGSDTLGGAAAGAGNLISGNFGDGVVIDGEVGDPIGRVVIQGNRIGVTIDSTAPLANGGDGISLPDVIPTATSAAPTVRGDVIIGGPAPGDGNVISGNHGAGIVFGGNPGNSAHGPDGPLAGVVVQGNAIGTDPTGTLDLGNRGDGVALDSTVTPATIGGTNPGEGNVIAFNAGMGVDQKTIGFPIRGNAIFDNAISRASIAPAGFQVGSPSFSVYAAPILTAAIEQGGNVTIFGAFAGQFGQARTFEFFASASSDPAGATTPGGRVYLGTAQAMYGFIRITFPIPTLAPTPGGGSPALNLFTATDIYGPSTGGTAPDFGGTSGFSNPVRLAPVTTPLADLRVGLPAPTVPYSPQVVATLTLTVDNLGPAPAYGVTVEELFPNGGPLRSATPSQGFVTFTPDGDFVAQLGTIQPGASVTILVRTGLTEAGQGRVVARDGERDFLVDALVTSLTPDVRAGGNAGENSVAVAPDILYTAADLSLAGTATPSPAPAGGTVTYTLTATNRGPGYAVNSVIFFALPGDAAFVSAASSQGTILTNPGATSGGYSTAFLGPIAGSAHATFTVVVRVRATARGRTLVGQGVVQSDEPDTNPDDNFASQIVTIR